MPPDFVVRPMTPVDVHAVERLTDEAFLDLDAPHPPRRLARAGAARRGRLGAVAAPDGAPAAARPPRLLGRRGRLDGLLGAAVSLKRDLTLDAGAFAVRPGVQGRGVGRQLLDAALSYGSGCLRA